VNAVENLCFDCDFDFDIDFDIVIDFGGVDSV
jgi:hypothetical protein